ncbi:MAG: hypothetical protein KTR29_07220 [Rhodothermaceae bacterium]|nr:hypothetical protein [Rhodothermaceae bacterium]
MRRFLPVLLLAFCVFSGCTSTRTVHENEDLVTFSHNKATDYTLLVYQSENGDKRQVLRHNGVCEMILIETRDGDYTLKKRGEDSQKLEPHLVPDVKSRMHSLIYSNISDANISDLRL